MLFCSAQVFDHNRKRSGLPFPEILGKEALMFNIFVYTKVHESISITILKFKN